MLEARRKEQREALQQKQAGRRFTLEGEAKALTARQRQAGYDLAVRQKEGRTVLRQAYLQETIRRNPRNVAYCETGHPHSADIGSKCLSGNILKSSESFVIHMWTAQNRGRYDRSQLRKSAEKPLR
jgi:hypothetical protein